MIELRDYQIKGAEDVCTLLNEKKLAYLVWEVRTGKTLTALRASDLYKAKKVLFLTKLKAISSIKTDYDSLKPSFEIQIINNESIHKITDNDFDLVISDESHRNSAFPRPNKTAKIIKDRFGNLPMILLSGTPAIESGSQWFHSFWISNHSPFKIYRNFYAWAKDYTTPKVKYLGAIQVKDYSASIDSKILPIIEPYLIKRTQEESGFISKITEKVLYCEMSELTNILQKQLFNDRCLLGNTEEILADTPVKLMSKIHQLSNGTIIFESGKAKIMDDSKAKFIKTNFEGCKIAIFYFFQKEYELLKTIFGDELTNDLNEFNETNKSIALQQVAGSEGLSLKNAEYLVYYSFGYSGKNYVQGRDRMTTMERKFNEVFFVFQKGDINEKIYKRIIDKKAYNIKLFANEYRIKITK